MYVRMYVPICMYVVYEEDQLGVQFSIMTPLYVGGSIRESAKLE